MVEKVGVEVVEGMEALESPMLRYDLLERLARSAGRVGVVVLAFGFAPEGLRLVLDGAPDAIGRCVLGVKVGTTRSLRCWDVGMLWGRTERCLVDDLDGAVGWAHAGPVDAGAMGPLASPWSSHRDLLGHRVAPFFDAAPVRRRVDADRVHALAGGARRVAERVDVVGPSLPLLLRIAAGVLGVLPADRRCFRLFVHVARRRGWPTRELARALALTTRRVRQLAASEEPSLPLAEAALADARLSLVP